MGLLDQYDKAKKYAAGLLAQVPQNAQDMYQGLLSAPSQVSDLFSQQKAQQLAKALKNPQQANPKQWMDAGLELTSMAPVMGLLGHTVYHGSPHKFDAFDMSKIGTGEGAQAYGHGLYFAESPDVAKSYIETSGTNQLIANAKDLIRNTDLFDSIESASNAVDQAKRFISAQKGGSYPPQIATNPNLYSKKEIDGFNYAVDQLKNGKLGSFYKVDIPDESIPRMLDWDKPLSEQAPEVQAAILATKGKLPPNAIDDMGGDIAPLYDMSQTPGDFLGTLASLGGRQDFGEGLLKQAGIPGIRYLDGSSRNAGQGTSNFVLFDDQLPRILEVNGQPTGLKPWKAK